VTALIVALQLDALGPAALAGFCSRVLDRTIRAGDAVLPGRSGSGLDFEVRFVLSGTPKTSAHRMHVDLTSDSLEDR